MFKTSSRAMRRLIVIGWLTANSGQPAIFDERLTTRHSRERSGQFPLSSNLISAVSLPTLFTTRLRDLRERADDVPNYNNREGPFFLCW